MDSSVILGIVSGVLFIVSLLSYGYASKLNKENTSRIKKEQKAQLKRRSGTVKVAAHSLLVASIVLALIILLQQNSGQYDLETLNYDVQIEVVNDKDYGAAHSETNVLYEMALPTSGTHSFHDLKFGFYTERPSYEELVHNLEHGDIIIYYRPDADVSIKDSAEYLSHFRKAGAGVLAVPTEDIPDGKEVVVTAWLKTMELTTYDEQKTGAFIYANINEGPEKIPPSIRRGGGTM
jgi:preprotein translocase subunit SecG